MTQETRVTTSETSLNGTRPVQIPTCKPNAPMAHGGGADKELVTSTPAPRFLHRSTTVPGKIESGAGSTGRSGHRRQI